jgi:hypothetical protein
MEFFIFIFNYGFVNYDLTCFLGKLWSYTSINSGLETKAHYGAKNLHARNGHMQ